MERVTRNEQLHVLAAAQVRPNDDALRPAVGVQQEQFQGIAEIIMVKLVVSNPVEAYGRVGRDKEIKRGTQRPASFERRRQCAGRQRLLGYECHAHEAACRVRLEIQQFDNLIRGQFGSHCVANRLFSNAGSERWRR
jgi:hypothetical protein